jgi:hypothetical protein
MILDKGLRTNIFILLFILINLYSLSYQITIPVRQVKTKFQKSIPKKVSDKSTQSISDQFNTLDNYLFAADIEIGSNKQPFTVLLDTGSEILWVPGQDESTSKKYIPSNSITSKRTSEPLNYEYASGRIKGYYYNDQINFLLSNSFYANFGVSTYNNLLEYFFDGILGLGRKYRNSKNSILQAIKMAGGVSDTKFSFKYDYNSDNIYFYLGEDHSDFKNENLASCPLIDSDIYGTSLWLCKIYSLGIKEGDTIVKRITLKLEGLFDTGTNNIIFPSKYISDFQSTIESFNCFLYEEGDSLGSRQKAIYCRNPDNLPKITIGVKEYILTMGKSNFYNKIYVNGKLVYRLRFIFIQDIDFCIIGQNFFYEYHTLFDDRNSVLKFYNDDQTKIVYHEENDDEEIKTWMLIIYIVGGTIIVGSITAIIIIYFCCKRKKAVNKNIILNKELLEMSSIKKDEDYDDEDDNNESDFNKIMSITSDKSHKRINININTKN